MKKQFSRKRKMVKEPKEYDEEVIQIDRVTRVVKGGRRLRFRALVVIGNRKGKVGMGIGKSSEVSTAIQKAISAAKKEIVDVPMNNTTITHEIKTKFKSSQLLLLPAGPGTGIIAGGPVRKLIALSGIKDILGKSFGSTNKINITKAAFEGLKSLRILPGTEKKLAAEKKASEKKASKEQPKNDAPAPKKAEEKATT